tara:strand:- start:394 stop:954 length:561 start_codon:yes stop_codon:yes gene_type:complete
MRIEDLKKMERRKFHLIRKNISLDAKNNIKKNIDTLLNSQFEKKLSDKYIAIYWPLKDEIDLRDLKNKYPIALPRCNSNRVINFYEWDDSPLKEDKEGIPAPPENSLLLGYDNISLIFVPCLSIDKRFIRLGYGGGYYDKLRSNKLWKSIPCIGILYSKCVSKNYLIKAEWDIPLNGYVTDKEIIL